MNADAATFSKFHSTAPALASRIANWLKAEAEARGTRREIREAIASLMAMDPRVRADIGVARAEAREDASPLQQLGQFNGYVVAASIFTMKPPR